jgi:hypothetical protein
MAVALVLPQRRKLGEKLANSAVSRSLDTTRCVIHEVQPL